MKKLYTAILCVLCLILLSSFVIARQNVDITTSTYKCMVQLTNYTGEGAYIVVSVLDKNGKYLETLQVLGDDKEWYPDLPKWWNYFTAEKEQSIDAIVGATIAGGERSVFVLEIEDQFINNGNQLRFETAVENQKYSADDVKLPLNTVTLSGKYEGEGYIRYVRFIPNK